MANPRKFSDKLEIIRRKEEEANAAFEKIMREVSDARSGTTPANPLPHQSHWFRGQQNDMRINQRYKGGSLPNVNLGPHPMTVDGGMNMYNDVYARSQHSYNVGVGHMRRPMDPPSGPIFPSKNKPRSSPYRNSMLQTPPAIAEQQNESTSMWRRTYSDSAIQHSLQQPPPKKVSDEPPMAPYPGGGGGGGSIGSGGGPRIIQTPSQQMKSDLSSYQSSAAQYGDPSNTQKSHMQSQANTNSLPDLSNLSIPSPIQNPIDNENNSCAEKSNNSQQESGNPFQVPYRVAPRRNIGKQIYSRQLNQSTPEMDPKIQLNLYPGIEKNDINLPGGINNSQPVSHGGGPISPVTPPPYFWSSTPMSPLATEDLMHSQSSGNLQQQLQQMIPNDSSNQNGMHSLYSYSNPGNNESSDNFLNYLSNSYSSKHSGVYRMNSGPSSSSSSPHMNPMNNSIREREFKSNQICDRQLDSALMKVKSQNNNNTLNEHELNCVALDPLNFDDVQILNENTELVDQSAEEQFRMERAGYHQ